MLKNVSTRPTTIKGYKLHTLFNPDGSENIGYSLYRDRLIKTRRGLSIHTIKSYLNAVANFFDYLFEIAINTESEVLTEDLIYEAIDSWDEYLVEGELSENDFVTKICDGLPSPRVQQSTSAQYHAGLKNFLLASEKLRRSMNDLHNAGLLKDDPLQANNPLVTIPAREKLPHQQRNSLIAKSMLAGVIKGGPQLASPTLFPNISSGSDARDFKEFPYDKIVELIDNLPNSRDKALYSFIAASGCRIHEALRILICDIDIEERTVALVNPTDRLNDGYYDSFATSQRKIICVWKGRQTEATFLIEPFKSLFFKYASEYWNNDKPHDVEHEFFFCCTDRDNYGKPFLFATAKSIRAGYNDAKEKVLGKATYRLGPHSLRHSYGYYLTNFCPRIDGGYGLDLPMVQSLMGHAEVASTQRYSRIDKMRAELEIEYSNALVYDIKEHKSVDEVRRDILLKELMRVEATINTETKLKRISNTRVDDSV